MQVAKWGNSLAIRIPQAVAEALELKEGDEIEIRVTGKREFAVDHDRRGERLMERLKQMSWHFPPGYKFEREEIYEERLRTLDERADRAASKK